MRSYQAWLIIVLLALQLAATAGIWGFDRSEIYQRQLAKKEADRINQEIECRAQLNALKAMISGAAKFNLFAVREARAKLTICVLLKTGVTAEDVKDLGVTTPEK